MKVHDSDKEYVVAPERGFKCQSQPPTGHFERLLKAACPNHTYPIRHKLKKCGMMKNFMTAGALTKARSPKETWEERARHPSPGRRRS
jgi:hypothetical protein